MKFKRTAWMVVDGDEVLCLVSGYECFDEQSDNAILFASDVAAQHAADYWMKGKPIEVTETIEEVKK